MIEIKRGNTVIWSGNAKGQRYRKVMQDDRCVISISSPTPIVFELYDTVTILGRTYKLNRTGNINQSNDKIGYSYDLEFEALYYDLGKWELKTLDKNNELTEGEVYLMSNAATVLELVVRNANRVSSGWSLGIVDNTEVMQYAYSNSKLLTVLQDVADKNRLEFWVDGKVINLTIRQPETGLVLEHGKGKGFYSIERQRTQKSVINKLTVLGGSRNIQTGPVSDGGYGFAKLQPTGGNPLTVPAIGDVIEETIEFANIYPRLNAKVTATSAMNIVRSTDINFNLANQLLNNGEKAKIAFTSGQLAGFTFDINGDGWDNVNKQITFNVITEDPAYPSGIPNNVLKSSVGDSFVLLDIHMPAEYTKAAEDKLKELGTDYLNENKVSTYNWTASLTPSFVLENNITIQLGGVVTVVFEGITYKVRISGYTQDILEPYKYDITIDAVITIADIVRQANAQDRLSNSVSKGIGADGSANTRETIDSVARRGKITPLVLELGGSENDRVLGVPDKAPSLEDAKAGKTYFWSNDKANSGEDPVPGADMFLRDLLDVDVAGVLNGQALTYDATRNKWVPATPIDLTGYARESWVLAQDYAPKSWVNGQGYLTKVVADGLYKPLGYVPSWTEITGKPLISVEPLANSIVLRNSNGEVLANFFRSDISALNVRNDSDLKSMYGNDSSNGTLQSWGKQAVNQFLGSPPNGDTLQSVGARGNSYYGPLTIGGDSVNSNFTKLFISNAYGTTWSLSSGANLRSENNFAIYSTYMGYDTPHFMIELGGNQTVMPLGGLSVGGKVTAPVMQPTALIFPDGPPSNPEPNVTYVWSD